MVPKYRCGRFGWVLGRSCVSLGAASPSCLRKDENFCVQEGKAALSLPVSHHSPWMAVPDALLAPGFGVSVLFLGAGKAGAMSSCPARHSLPFSVARGISHPERFESHCFWFYFSVDALLFDVRLVFRSVVAVPCIYFYCVQLYLRGDISASRFLVGLCVCERGLGRMQ